MTVESQHSKRGYQPAPGDTSAYRLIKGRSFWDYSFQEFLLTRQFNMFYKVCLYMYFYGKLIPFIYLAEYLWSNEYTFYKNLFSQYEVTFSQFAYVLKFQMEAYTKEAHDIEPYVPGRFTS